MNRELTVQQLIDELQKWGNPDAIVCVNEREQTVFSVDCISTNRMIIYTNMPCKEEEKDGKQEA